MDVKDRLNKMDADWDSTQNSTNGTKEYDPIPDGQYQARVRRFDFHESKKDGNLLLRTEFEIVAPTNEGRVISSFHDLENPERLGYAKNHLLLLGVEVERLSEVENALPAALDKVCEIAVKSRQVGDRTYQNVYLNKVLEGVKAEASKPKSPADLDDIPF
jgi:hypothetical protein